MERPIIVCLCGSTKFGGYFAQANLEETLKGKIVLSIGCNMRTDDEIFEHLSTKELMEIKEKLDKLHLRKIDIADEILVLNIGGYIGESTKNEINYATLNKKRIRYFEDIS